MASEWPRVSLEMLVRPERPITYGVVKPGLEDSAGVTFVRGGDISDGRIAVGQLRTITHEVSSQYKRTLLAGGELLVSLVGNPGEVAIAPVALRGANIARQVGLVSLRDDVDSRYVQYYLSSPLGKQSLRAQSLGSVQAVINLRDLKRVELSVPPLMVQREISSVLGALDDRIDLLRTAGMTLEAIAQAVFKSWFVDFDPVRAKAEGLTPVGMDADTAALFPGEFEESELGLIPKGWQPTLVDDVVTIVKGRSYKSAELADSDVALVTLKSFQRGGGFRRDGFKPYTGTYKNEQVVQEGECIVAFTDVTQQAELIGRTAIVTASQQCGRLVASLDVGILRPKLDGMTPAFLRALLSGERYVGHIKGYTTGTTVLHLAKAGLPSYPFVMPPSELMASWQEVGGACIEQQALNVQKIDVLTELRDTLLPRLISGKLRLPEAEAAIEEALA